MQLLWQVRSLEIKEETSFNSSSETGLQRSVCTRVHGHTRVGVDDRVWYVNTVGWIIYEVMYHSY